jgi:RND family efflux transporter MFP subunit
MSLRYALPLILLATACGGAAEGRQSPAESVTPVQLAPVVPAGQGGIISASGTLGAKDEITLSFKIGGVVARVMVDEGASVRRAQVLAALDQREIDAMLAKATAGAEKARRDALRVERLHRDSVVTIAQWQDAETALEAAEADLRAAKVNKEYATIIAPSDGVVLMRIASAGQIVGAGAPVLQFASRARGSVLRVGLPDRDAVRVRVGDRAEATFEAVPGKTFRGRVSQVGAAADPRTGLITVEIALAGVSALPSGLVGRASIASKGAGPGTAECTATTGCGATGRVFSIPAEALVEGNGDAGTVFTVDASGTRATRVPVQLVALDGNRVLVRGLDGVSRVVRSGATWLADSARVEIKP